jgi:hypothetical protein
MTKVRLVKVNPIKKNTLIATANIAKVTGKTLDSFEKRAFKGSVSPRGKYRIESFNTKQKRWILNANINYN